MPCACATAAGPAAAPAAAFAAAAPGAPAPFQAVHVLPQPLHLRPEGRAVIVSAPLLA